MSLQENSNSYYWSFKSDKVNDYAYWDNFLTKEEKTTPCGRCGKPAS